MTTTAYTAIGTVTLEYVVGSRTAMGKGLYQVVRRDGDRVTRTIPLERAMARRIFAELTR